MASFIDSEPDYVVARIEISLAFDRNARSYFFADSFLNPEALWRLRRSHCFRLSAHHARDRGRGRRGDSKIKLLARVRASTMVQAKIAEDLEWPHP